MLENPENPENPETQENPPKESPFSTIPEKIKANIKYIAFSLFKNEERKK